MKKKLYFTLLLLLLVLCVSCINHKEKEMEVIDDANIQRLFDDVDGVFIQYDDISDTYYVYNKNLMDKAVSPCSTFKIINSLIALETGVSNIEDNRIEWSGNKYYFDTWNKNQTMNSAFENSVVWYYQDIARMIGEKRMAEHILNLEYGNNDITGGIDQFWLASSLKISPLDQVEVLYRIFEGQSDFSNANVEYVKEIMFNEENDEGRIFGKTGSSTTPNIGWYIGFVEEDENIKYFATLITSDANEMEISGSRAKKITGEIFKLLHK